MSPSHGDRRDALRQPRDRGHIVDVAVAALGTCGRPQHATATSIAWDGHALTADVDAATVDLGIGAHGPFVTWIVGKRVFVRDVATAKVARGAIRGGSRWARGQRPVDPMPMTIGASSRIECDQLYVSTTP